MGSSLFSQIVLAKPSAHGAGPTRLGRSSRPQGLGRRILKVTEANTPVLWRLLLRRAKSGTIHSTMTESRNVGPNHRSSAQSGGSSAGANPLLARPSTRFGVRLGRRILRALHRCVPGFRYLSRGLRHLDGQRSDPLRKAFFRPDLLDRFCQYGPVSQRRDQPQDVLRLVAVGLLHAPRLVGQAAIDGVRAAMGDGGAASVHFDPLAAER